MTKKKIVRTSVSALLAVCMLVALVSMPAFMATGISRMNADFALPVAGQTPDFYPTTPADANYSVFDTKWELVEAGQDSVTYTELSPNDVFEEGKDYRVTVTFEANADYAFIAENDMIVGYFNGVGPMENVESIDSSVEYEKFAVSQVYTAEAPHNFIESVTVIEIDAPVAGNTPDYRASKPAGDPYMLANNLGTSGGIAWYDLSGVAETEMAADAVFEAGKTYRVKIWIEAEYGYYFPTNDTGNLEIKALLDGETVDAFLTDPAASQDVRMIYITRTFTVEEPTQEPTATPISEIHVNDVTVPVEGANPDFDVTAPAGAGYTVTAVVWERFISGPDGVEFIALQSTDTFEADCDYRMTVTVAAEDGYAFTSNADSMMYGYINGDRASFIAPFESGEEYTTFKVGGDYYVEAAQTDPTVITISEAEITITEPVYGSTLMEDYAIPAAVNYSIDSVIWTNTDTNEVMAAGDTFGEGGYQVKVTFRANSGYAFGPNANGVILGKINGATAMPATSVGEGLETYSVYTEFYIESPYISEAKVTVMEPAIGDTLSTGYGIPANVNYSIASIVWTNMTTGQVMAAGDVFEDDTDYQVKVTFRANNGYAFAPNADGVILGYINDAVAMPATSIGAEPLQTYSVYTEFYLTSTPPTVLLSEAEITVMEPVAGDTLTADYGIPADANYTVDSVVWTNTDTNEVMAEGDLFKAGGSYQVKVTFCANAGYAFAPNADDVIIGKINGATAMPATQIGNGNLETYSVYTEIYIEEYEMLEGEDGTWAGDRTRPLRFRASGNFENFVEVRVNRRVVARRYYTAKSGSTIIELTPEFLATLPEGEHELTVVYTDGEVSTSFFITDAPKTADTANMAGFAAAAMTTMLCAGAMLLLRRKQNNA